MNFASLISDWIIENYIELLGVIFSLLYLWFSIRQKIWLWPVGILSALIYIIVFYESKFYADMSLNVYYFAISIYGWINWSRPTRGDDVLQVSMISRKLTFILSVLCLILFIVIGIILQRFTDSPLPYWDALTTSASIIATWMLTKKILEHWIIWIAVDIISILLYIYRGLYPTAFLFAIYSAMAVIGYLNWKRSINHQKN